MRLVETALPATMAGPPHRARRLPI
jgi:hypothetical protein